MAVYSKPSQHSIGNQGSQSSSLHSHTESLDSSFSSESNYQNNSLLKVGIELCHQVARTIHRKIPSQYFDLDDLVQYGLVGLLGSIRTFDPSIGVKFKVYSHPRILGAIIDGIRQESGNSRSALQRNKVLKNLIGTFSDERSHLSDYGKTARDLGLDIEDLEGILRVNSVVCTLSLDAMGITEARDNSDFKQSANIPCDNKEPPPLRSLENREFLQMALKGLNRNERLVIIEYFYLGSSMKEAAATIGLSESRVSQILPDILFRVANNLKRYYGDEPLGSINGNLNGLVSDEHKFKRETNPAAGGSLADLSFDWSD